MEFWPPLKYQVYGGNISQTVRLPHRCFTVLSRLTENIFPIGGKDRSPDPIIMASHKAGPSSVASIAHYCHVSHRKQWIVRPATRKHHKECHRLSDERISFLSSIPRLESPPSCRVFLLPLQFVDHLEENGLNSLEGQPVWKHSACETSQ